MWPISGSATMPLIMSIALSIAGPEDEAMVTVPSSSMLTLAPLTSTISRITLPPEPITSRILSLGIEMVTMRGAVDGRNRRPAGANQRRGAAPPGGHGGGAVRLRPPRHHADGVGNLGAVGQQRPARPPSQLAVADVAAAGAAHALHLADRVWRE